MKVLITGIAGFIGHKVALSFAMSGHEVIGVDNLSGGHGTQLPKNRLRLCGIDVCDRCNVGRIVSTSFPSLSVYIFSLEDKRKLERLFATEHFDIVLHFAAKAGVRRSIQKPYEYFRSNSLGFMNIIETSRKYNVKNFLFASSSSTYGSSLKFPLRENYKSGVLESFYAVTKSQNESTARYYARMYGMHCIGLRFFTVYGPWGRPDMAPMIFANAIFRGKTLNLYGGGDMKRDFTYIDDVISTVNRVVEYLSDSVHTDNSGFFDVFNVGTGKSVKVSKFLSIIEKSMKLSAKRRVLGVPPGDVYQTKADISKLRNVLGVSCETSLETGVERFVMWFYQYYESIIKCIIARKFKLDVNTICIDDSFIINYKADSLDMLDLIIRVEEEIGFRIPNNKIREIVTVRDLLKVLKLRI